MPAAKKATKGTGKGRGGMRSTTWAPGKGGTGRPPGKKNKDTELKEAIGLTGWDKLAEFVNGRGAERLVTEIESLDGNDYVKAMNAISEYIKPKLNRTTHANDDKNPLPAPIIMLPPGAAFSFPASEADVDVIKKP